MRPGREKKIKSGEILSLTRPDADDLVNIFNII